jgi:plasmid stabilization system protein ParE
VPVTVAILPEAQRMVDEADERWVAEHGFLADNPLLNEILQASDLLRAHPQIGVVVRRGRSEIRRILLHSGWHIYYRFHGDRQLVEPWRYRRRRDRGTLPSWPRPLPPRLSPKRLP